MIWQALEPSEPTAREWLTRELAKGEYAEAQPTLYDRFMDWLDNVLANAGSLSANGGVLLIVLTVVVIVVAVLLVNGPARRAQRIGGGSAAVFGSALRTASDHRKLAEQHAAAGRWAEAIQERFRAIVRSLQERTVLDDRPGLTADEAAGEAGRRFGALEPRLRQAALAFDEVSFGDRPGDRARYAELAQLDADLTAARPAALTGPAGTLAAPR